MVFAVRAVFLLASVSAYAQAELEAPVAIVTAGSGEKRAAGEDAWHPVGPGVEFYAGDSLRSADQAITFAFCPSGPNTMAASLHTLRAAVAVGFGKDVLAAPAGVLSSAALPLCLLPLLERTAVPNTLDDPYTRVALPGNLAARIEALPADIRDRLRPKLAAADAMTAQSESSLLGEIARAVLLEDADLVRDALDIYRHIRDTVSGADWTAGVIERLTREQLSRSRPPLSVNSGDTDLSPRLVGDPKALKLPGAEPNFAAGQTYALIIGISSYNPLSGVTDLRYSHLDAQSFRDYLKTPRAGDVPDDHIWLLLNEEATRDRIDFNLSEFVKGKAGENNTLIVFIAAHGAYACKHQDLTYDKCQPGDENEEPVVLVRESDPQNPRLTGFPMQRLRTLLTDRAKDFGRIVLYIDVCHAGNLRDPPPGGLVLPSRKATKSLQASEGELGILMASSVEEGQPERQLAYEDDGLKHGIFSYFVLTGLNGDAEPTKGTLSFDQLYSHVSRQVTSFTQDRQAPDRFRTRSSLKVVDNTNIKGSPILLPSATGLISEARSRSAGPSEAESRFTKALTVHHLLAPDPDNASDALEQLLQAYGSNSALYGRFTNQFRVALEEEGQKIILKYLEGDQTAQTEADFLKGAAFFRRALNLAPDAGFDRSRLLFCEGRALIFQKNYRRAVELLEKSVRLDPTHSYARNALGIAYLEQVPQDSSFFGRAVAAFRDSIRLAPYWAYPRHNLALTYTQTGQFAEAQAGYTAAMRLAPRFSYLPYNAGLLEQQLNRPEEARAYYRKAIMVANGRCADRVSSSFQICSERSAPLTALASITQRRSVAIKLFRNAIRDDPDNVPARHDFAVLLARKKSGKTEAEALWKAILAADAGYLPSLIVYSEFLKEEHRFAESIPLYTAILKQQPGFLPVTIDFALALTSTGMAEQGLTVLDQVASADNQNPALWAARAEILRALGQSGKAKEAAQNARMLRKRSATSIATAGQSR